MSKRFATYTLTDLTKLKRKQLQTLCKIFGVKTALKTESLLDALTNVANQDDGVLKLVPFTTDEKEDTLFTVKEKEPIQIALTKFRAQSIGRLYEIESGAKKRRSRNVKTDEDGVKEYFPSVTTVLDHTKTYWQRIALLRWKDAKIRELGKDAFYAMSRETLASGTHFHKVISDHLKLLSLEENKTCKIDEILPEKPEEESAVHNLVKSISHVLKEVTFVFAIESSIQHPLLRYAGTLDCIVELNGKVCLIDWKTSSKYRRTLASCYDYPVQAVAYAGAANFDKQYNFQTTHVCLAIAYEDGSPADLHTLSPEQCEEYWLQWLSRLSAFYKDYPWETFQTFRATTGTTYDVDKGVQKESSALENQLKVASKDVSSPDNKLDISTSDNVSDTSTSDDVSDTSTSYNMSDCATSDNKSDTSTLDNKSDVSTPDSKSELSFPDTKMDVSVPDSKSDIYTTNTKSDVFTTDNKSKISASGSKFDVYTADNKSDVLVPDKLEASTIKEDEQKCRVATANDELRACTLLSNPSSIHSTVSSIKGKIDLIDSPTITIGTKETISTPKDDVNVVKKEQNFIASKKAKTKLIKGKYKLTNFLAVTKPALKKYLSLQKK